MVRFTPADHTRITAAIRAAEAKTAGEIFAVLARSSDSYFFPAAFFALALSLVAGLVTALAAWFAGVTLPAFALELTQTVGAGAILLLLQLFPTLRMALVPAGLKTERAHRMAMAQFMAHNLHATAERTGVLIFVSEAEHHAEIVADAGIHAKVPQAEWDAIVLVLTEAARADRLADGMIEAIARAGRLLATHFPAGAGNPNELPDRLVEL